MKAFGFAVCFTVLAACAGCGLLKKKQLESAPSATAPVAVAPVQVVSVPIFTTPPPDLTVPDEAVPAPEDFEQSAAEKITATTYRAELTALQKVIASP